MLQLSINYFYEHKTSMGNKVIKLNKPNIWFVFFYTAYCHYCNAFHNEFANIATLNKKINFAECNVNDGSQNTVATLMNDSKTPIKNVPYFLLYSEGFPKARYTGSRTQEDIKDFIDQYLVKLQSNVPKSIKPVLQPQQQSQVYQPQQINDADYFDSTPSKISKKPPPIIQNDFNLAKDYYPEGYKNGQNPDMGMYNGNMLKLPREVRPFNEPFRYASGKN